MSYRIINIKSCALKLKVPGRLTQKYTPKDISPNKFHPNAFHPRIIHPKNIHPNFISHNKAFHPKTFAQYFISPRHINNALLLQSGNNN